MAQPEFWKGLGGAVFAGWGDVSPDIRGLTTAAELYTIGLGFATPSTGKNR